MKPAGNVGQQTARLRMPPAAGPGRKQVMALRTGTTAQATGACILSARQDNHQLPRPSSRLQDDWR